MSINVIDNLKNNSSAELKILVVDDDELNQRMLRLILMREGYQVFVASNGVEAFEMAKARDFDVILMDLQMPVLDGIGASRRIRDWEKGEKHTFIVALTASFLPERGQELYEAGIDNYISKPFDLEHLRQVIRYSQKNGNAVGKTALHSDSTASGVSFELGLRRVGGSEETYKELLEDFILELPGKLEILQSCHLKNDLELLSRTAHNLKGVSANLGAMHLSEQAGRLEKQIDSGVSGEIKHIIEMVMTAADEFQTSASEYLSG